MARNNRSLFGFNEVSKNDNTSNIITGTETNSGNKATNEMINDKTIIDMSDNGSNKDNNSNYDNKNASTSDIENTNLFVNVKTNVDVCKNTNTKMNDSDSDSNYLNVNNSDKINENESIIEDTNINEITITNNGQTNNIKDNNRNSNRIDNDAIGIKITNQHSIKNVSNNNYIDSLLEGKQKQKEQKYFVGFYLDSDVFIMLNRLANMNSNRGIKSKIANECFREVFRSRGLL